MFARSLNKQWVLWQGEPFQHPLHPEWGPQWKPDRPELWSTQDQIDAGLHLVVQDVVPSNKIATAWALTDVSGVPHYIPTIADPPPPQIISDRQFFQQAATQGLCTPSEALAVVQIGSLPSALAPLVAALPLDQQFAAKMMLCGNVTFDRNHPLVAALGQAFFGADKAPAALDALWAAASLL